MRKNNPDITKTDEYIHRCCNNMEDINTLFDKTPSLFDKTPWNLTLLHMACIKGHHKIIRKLFLESSNNNFKYPIDVNLIFYFNGQTPLHYVCSKDDPITVCTLLQHPYIEVDKGDDDKSAPLHVACLFNRKANVIELLKHTNIQVIARDKFHYIPLHIACHRRNDDTDIIQILLGYQQQQFRNVQLNAINNRNQTPFLLACLFCNSVAVVHLLLEHAAIIDINATDNVGNTALHYACSSYDYNLFDKEIRSNCSEYHFNDDRICIIKKLLEQPSIMIYKKNNNGQTPFDMCQQNGPQDDSMKKQYKKQLRKQNIQLFEDYHIQRRWQIYCFLIKSLRFNLVDEAKQK